MFRDLDPDSYDIACIQEPYINPVNLAPGNSRWEAIYPSCHGSNGAQPSRSKKISKNSWRIIPFDHADVTVIELSGPFGKILLYNIY
ncbi:uncharacterized protein HD556DRAFT_1247201, partial [Suillus plorans]